MGSFHCVQCNHHPKPRSNKAIQQTRRFWSKNDLLRPKNKNEKKRKTGKETVTKEQNAIGKEEIFSLHPSQTKQKYQGVTYVSLRFVMGLSHCKTKLIQLVIISFLFVFSSIISVKNLLNALFLFFFF